MAYFPERPWVIRVLSTRDMCGEIASIDDVHSGPASTDFQAKPARTPRLLFEAGVTLHQPGVGGLGADRANRHRCIWAWVRWTQTCVIPPSATGSIPVL